MKTSEDVEETEVAVSSPCKKMSVKSSSNSSKSCGKKVVKTLKLQLVKCEESLSPGNVDRENICQGNDQIKTIKYDEKFDFLGFDSEDISLSIKNTYIKLQSILEYEKDILQQHHMTEKNYSNANYSQDTEPECLLEDVSEIGKVSEKRGGSKETSPKKIKNNDADSFSKPKNFSPKKLFGKTEQHSEGNKTNLLPNPKESSEQEPEEPKFISREKSNNISSKTSQLTNSHKEIRHEDIESSRETHDTQLSDSDHSIKKNCSKTKKLQIVKDSIQMPELCSTNKVVDDKKMEEKLGSEKKKGSDHNLLLKKENIGKQLKEDQDHHLSLKHPSDYDFTKTCTLKHDGMFEVPGLSFIIGIKPDSAEGKASYDCVICNCERVPVTFSGPEMKSHVLSRKHIVNVMLVENPAMYDQYGKDLQISTKSLLNKILKYESSQQTQKIVSATMDTYSEQREKVIAVLRQLISLRLGNVYNKNILEDVASDDKEEFKILSKKIPLHITMVQKKFKKSSTNNEGVISSVVKRPIAENELGNEDKSAGYSKPCTPSELNTNVFSENLVKRQFIMAKGSDISNEVPCDKMSSKRPIDPVSEKKSSGFQEKDVAQISNNSEKLTDHMNDSFKNSAMKENKKYVKEVEKNKEVSDDKQLVHRSNHDQNNESTPIKGEIKKRESEKYGRIINSTALRGSRDRSVEVNKLKYERVVVIADEKYLPYLDDIKIIPKVILRSPSNLEIDEIEFLIKKETKHSTRKTMFLLVTGIHSIVKSNEAQICLDKKCRHPLRALQLKFSRRNVIKQTGIFIEKLKTAVKSIKTFLPRGSNIAILPPLPIVLHDTKDHGNLHKRYDQYPLFKLFNWDFDLYKWYPTWIEKLFDTSRSTMIDLSNDFDCLNIIDKLNSDEYKKINCITDSRHADKVNYHLWGRSVENIISFALKGCLDNDSQSPIDSDYLRCLKNNNYSPLNDPKTNYAVDSSNKELKRVQNRRKADEYNHLIFIGNADSLKLIPELMFCNYSKWHFDYITETSNLISKINSIDKKIVRKALFIIISDVSMIGLEETNPECLVRKCEHLLTYTKALNPTTSITATVKSVIDSVRRVMCNIEKYCDFDLKILVAPFTPRIYVLISNIIIFHGRMHSTVEDQLSVRFLRGSTKKVWEDSLSKFAAEWKILSSNSYHKQEKENGNIRTIMSKSVVSSPISWKDLAADRPVGATEHPPITIWRSCIVALAKNAFMKNFDCSEFFANSFSNVTGKLGSNAKNNQFSKTSTCNLHSDFSKNVSRSTPPPLMSLHHPPPFQATYLPPPTPFLPPFPPPVQPPPTLSNNARVPYSDEMTKLPSVSFNPQTTVHHPSSSAFGKSNLSKVSRFSSISNDSPSDTINIPLPLDNNKVITSESSVEQDVTSKKGINREHDEIIQFARTIQNLSKTDNYSSHSSKFSNVCIVGPRGLINPLLECNIKATMIYHNFASFEDSDIKTLLYQMGDLQQNSLCCLVFDFSVIATKLIMSSGCFQQSCQQPIFVVALKTEPKPSETNAIEQLIRNQIEIISKFIRKLSEHIPVIILPLWPTRIYCEEMSPNHHSSHTISNLGFPVVHGSQIVWQIVIRALIPSWNMLMELTNRNYDSSNYISSYIASNPKTFIILNNINDFMAHWTELDIWKAFTETFLLSLVPMKNGAFSSYNKNNASCSNSDRVDVVVTHISSAIPPKFFEELFYSADRNVFIIPDKDKYTLKGMTPGRANILVKKLNRYQLGDTVVAAHVLVDAFRKHPIDYDYSEFNLMQCLYISSIFEKVYKKWKPEIISNLTRTVDDVLDFVKLKTVPCEKGDHCIEPKLCTNYHNSLDIRRNPYENKYSDTLCMRPRRKDGLCHNGLKCQLSHNVYEIKFHPSNYQVKICSSGKSSEDCNSQDLCNHAHKESPELFYTPDWEDLTLIGPNLALKFFAGAIRAVRKIEDIQRPFLKVLLISPSKEFLDIAMQATSNLSKSFGLMTGSLDENIGYQDYYQILVGSPSIFSHLSRNIFLEKRGAIIIDDIQSILENDRHREDMRQFLQMMACSHNVVLNKVFICVTYDPRSTSIIADMAGMKPRLVHDLQTDLQMMTSSATHNLSQWVHTDPAASNSSSDVTKPISSSHNKWIPNSNIHNRNLESNLHQDRSLNHSQLSDIRYTHQKRSRSRSSSPSSFKKQRVTEQSFPSHQTGHTSQAVDLPNMDVENDLSKRFGKKLYEEYSVELEKMRLDFENEFAKYGILPELYPNYETYYESFTAMYNKQHVGRNPNHKVKLWQFFWKSKFDDIKKEDWELKENALREYFEEKSRKHSTSLQHNVDSGSSYSFAETLSLIESTCNDVGFLGPSVKAIIQSCRNLGTTTKESYNMFTESENIMLVNMVSEKLKSLAQSATGNSLNLYNRVINYIPKFLEEAKIGPVTQPSPSVQTLNIDLNSIAGASVGKGSKYALDLIKAAIAYEGISDPPKEVINDFFLKVCAIHFTLSMD